MDNRRRVATVTFLVLLLSLAVVPGLIFSAFGYAEVSGVTTLAAISGILPALLSTRAITVGVVVILIPASAIAVPASQSPWLAACLMGAAGALLGMTARVNAASPASIAVISLAFLVAVPPDMPVMLEHTWLITGIAAGVAAAWGAAMGWGAKHMVKRRAARGGVTPKEPPENPSWYRATGFAVVLAVTLGVASWFVVHLQLQHGGAWFLMTFVIIFQPYLQDAWEKTLQRAWGTILGVTLALVLYTVFEQWDVVLNVISIALIIAALTVVTTTKRPYWQFVTLLTPAIVLLEGLGHSLTGTALERIGFTLLAAAIALAIQLALIPVVRRQAQRAGATHY